MTEQEKVFVAMLLDVLNDRLSRDGCNDVPEEWQVMFSKSEHRQMALLYHDWNGDRDEAGDMIPANFCFAAFFAAKLRGEIP